MMRLDNSYRRRTAIEARRPVMEAYASWLLVGGAASNVVPLTRTA
jgi:hypothetical protein